MYSGASTRPRILWTFLDEMKQLDHEEFRVIPLDAKNCVLGAITVAIRSLKKGGGLMATIHRVAYAVAERFGKEPEKPRTWWVKIGVTFLNGDGSETILLDALPLKGKIILRPLMEKPENAE